MNKKIKIHFPCLIYNRFHSQKTNHYISIPKTVYPCRNAESNKTKSEMMALSIVKFLPFLGDTICEGYYRVVDCISASQVKTCCDSF